MHDLPFKLPKSLASYLEQYEKKPENTIGRFKKQLKRRGPDAVGLFVLAWLYFNQDEKDKAIECALKAKTLTPGSPFFENTHYFFSHPDLFDAWLTPSNQPLHQTHVDQSLSTQADLNTLIEKLSGMGTKRIQIDTDTEKKTAERKAYDHQAVDGIVSETLAKVHENQGKHADAIRIYKALKKEDRSKADFYNEKIETLEQHKSNSGD